MPRTDGGLSLLFLVLPNTPFLCKNTTHSPPTLKQPKNIPSFSLFPQLIFFSGSFPSNPITHFLFLRECLTETCFLVDEWILWVFMINLGVCHMEEMEFEYEEEYISNSRGVRLFTCRWVPLCSPKALVFLCHGYGMECSSFMRGCGTRLAEAGYGVFGIDYEGHGRSQGARCYIKKFDNIVKDSGDFFKSICEHEEYMGKAKFLYGESMGGAVALLLHKKDPNFWNGAVLVAPMCKISEKVKPHPVVINILTRVEEIIPKWKIVPTKDVIDSAFKDPIKREEIRSNKLIYQDKPRLKTALEMLRTSINLEDSLSEVTLPFFVLHGEADTVTDPEVSRALYERAGSSDKTIKLYQGMWHGLTSGEPDQSVEIVFADIFAWLDKHIGDTLTIQQVNTGLEKRVENSMAMQGDRQRQRRRRRCSQASYLCGWKGSMLHHSAM